MNPFADFPIEYKQINPEDFPHFNVCEKEIITPNSEGYIKDALLEKIQLDENNTVVINAGVGQGKTHAIIDIVKHYYDRDEFVIFIASPFVSLVAQYYKDIIRKGIDEASIFRYEVLGNEDPGEFWLKKVHIVTANCLLGNPGEDSFINAEVKRYYLNRLSRYCETSNKKVVFIYDEIHDTIHNFKEQYIFNLWKWRNVIHKNFIISATYNEASKIVIEYLAELTRDKIQIIESERIRFPEKQSELFLHFNNERFYTYDDPKITDLVRDLISFGKDIDILSYSKILAENIIKNKSEGIGFELYKKYDVINNCTSELIVNQRNTREIPQNRYNEEFCNVGTNFKTGVSIQKDNHAFIIIMPPKGAKMPFKNNYGIFSSGINSVIQAVARQRKKGEIHIILPRPYEFDYNSLPFEEVEQKEYFEQFYDKVRDNDEVNEKTEYLALSLQDRIFYDFYSNKLRDNMSAEISHVSTLSRLNKVRLEFPDYKLYKLKSSEDYFVNRTKFFGGDLSAYITYCAVTNQFLNCKFIGANVKNILILKYGEIQKGLQQYCKDIYFLDDQRMSFYYFLNDSYFYQQFRNDLFEMNDVKLLTTEGKLVNLLKDGTSKASEYFEQQLLGFVQHFGFPNNPMNRSKFGNREELKDGIYDRSQYYLELIAHADMLSPTDLTSSSTKDRISAFQFLGVLRQRMIDGIQSNVLGNGAVIRYLPVRPFDNFITPEETFKFTDLISQLVDEKDPINKRFSIKSRLQHKSGTARIKIIYTILLQEFFHTENYKIPTGDRKNVKKITFIKPLPGHTFVVNYVVAQDYNFPEGYEPNTLTEEEYISIKESIRKNEI